MNRLELIHSIQSLTDENLITFSIGDEKISNRFDRLDMKQCEKGDFYTEISYALYSYIANAIFLKAMGKEKASQGYTFFDQQWEEIIQGKETIYEENTKVVKDRALRLLDTFLSSMDGTTLNDLMEKIAPLCVLKIIKNHPKEEKKILRKFDKKKEIVYNQVTLFSRSLYHTFLNRSNLNPLLIQPDMDDLSNGVFVYDLKELIIPTWQNAFTLVNFKSVIKNGLASCSSEFPFKDIEAVSVIYMVKDIVGTYHLY